MCEFKQKWSNIYTIKKNLCLCGCMYKMSSEAERLTKERKITIETYTKNKNHKICINKKGVNGLSVIWVKVIHLQKGLVHQNLCYAAMKKIKSYCNTKNPTKKQVKKY